MVRADVTPPSVVLQADAARIEMIERVSPSVVCIFDEHLRGGGSGVLIDPAGYGLTNYHVIAGLLETRRGWGGLGDGVLYELQVLGIDVTGDVAMFRLIPPSEGFRFPFSMLGDSDEVRMGDTVVAMGNPFMLSEDYSPTVTVGMVTGTNRYQQGVRGNLVYSDSIQTDASINPGNSGGPLFNARGEIIGINGRISVNTRGRFNVGFGYAITTNQIRRFIPALRAGLLALHGTWQARVADRGDEVVVVEVASAGAAHAAGIVKGDRLVSIDGVAIRSANQVLSMLGTYPAEWPVRVELARDDEPLKVVVRLDAVQPDMRRPFEVDRRVNRREVRRVLGAFRKVVFGDEQQTLPDVRCWTVERRTAATDKEETDETGAIKSAGARRSARTGDPIRDDMRMGTPEVRGSLLRMEWRRSCSSEPATGSDAGSCGRIVQQFEDGTLGRIVEYDAIGARQRTAENAEPFDVTPDEALTLAAMFTIQRILFDTDENLDLSEALHVGGNLLLPGEFGGTRGVKISRRICGPDGDEETESRQGSEPRMVELVRWPMADGAVVRLAFDGETGLLHRATVQDTVGGREVLIDFEVDRPLGGLDWPHRTIVRAAGLLYCDSVVETESSAEEKCLPQP